VAPLAGIFARSAEKRRNHDVGRRVLAPISDPTVVIAERIFIAGLLMADADRGLKRPVNFVPVYAIISRGLPFNGGIAEVFAGTAAVSPSEAGPAAA
jgi:hypothetical protein